MLVKMLLEGCFERNHLWGGALRDDTKNSSAADYFGPTHSDINEVNSVYVDIFFFLYLS